MFMQEKGLLHSRDSSTLSFNDIDLKIGVSGFSSDRVEFTPPMMLVAGVTTYDLLDDNTRMRKELFCIMDRYKHDTKMNILSPIKLLTDKIDPDVAKNKLGFKSFAGVEFIVDGLIIRLIADYNNYRFAIKQKKQWVYFRSLGICLKTLRSKAG